MGYGVVNVWWLVNSMITDLDHPMNFYEKYKLTSQVSFFASKHNFNCSLIRV